MTDINSMDRVVGEGRNIKSKRKKNKQKKEKISRVEQFCLDFASEVDIFDSSSAVPCWIFNNREKLLQKLTPEFRRICLHLRELGLDFKIKFPIEIEGSWKFADILFPRQRTILLVVNPMEIASRPHWMLSDRGEFFNDRFRVVEVENLEDLKRKIRIKANHAS